MRTVPAVKFAILLVIGIVLGDALVSSAWTIFLFAAAALFCGLAYWGRAAFWGQAVLFMGVVLVGAALFAVNQPQFKRFEGWLGKTVWIRGHIAEQYPNRSGRQVHVLRPEGIQNGERLMPLPRGNFRFTTEPNQAAAMGSQILLRGIIEAYPLRRNPGGRNWRGEFLRNGIVGWVKADSILVLVSGREGIWAKMRRTLTDGLQRSLPPREADLLSGMILGDRGLIPEDLQDEFKRSGLYHLLVVSGANIGYLLATVTMLLSPLGLGLRSRRTVMHLCIWGYVFLTNLQPATVRAAIMISLFLLSFEFRRLPRKWNLWGVAAVIILSFAPLQLFQPGFQLSFAAMAGLLFAADIHERRELNLPDISIRARRIRRLLIRHLSFPLLASLCAVIFTAPILIFHFGGYAPVAVFLNLLAVPLAGTIFSLSWIILLFNLILGIAVGPLNAGVEWALKVLEQLAIWGSRMPGNGGGDYGGLALSLMFFSGLIAFFLLHRWRPRLLLLVSLLTGVLLVVIEPPSPHLQMEFLDVGQGEATLMRFPDGKTLLVDCGGEESARFELLPSLLRRGIRRVDALLITHFDKDHAGGAVMILKELDVQRLLVNTLEPNEDLGRSILDSATARGISARNLALGDTIAGFAVSRCQVLWPPRDYPGDDNAKSIVLRISYGSSDVFLTGDIGSREEAALASAGPHLDSEILKVAHHGSAKSSNPQLLDFVRPDYAMIGCGAKNNYGHPAARTLESLQRIGASVHRTDLDQAGIWRSDGERIWQIAWR